MISIITLISIIRDLTKDKIIVLITKLIITYFKLT